MSYEEFVRSSDLLRTLIPLLTITIIGCVLFGLVANVLLMVSILKQRALRESPTYLMLVSLAGSDTFVLLCVSLYVYFVYTGGVYKLICQMFLYSAFASTSSSTYHLVAFAIMRFILLTKPLFATKHVTTKCTIILCVVIWFLTLGVPVTSVLFTGLTTFNVSENNTVDICLVNFNSHPVNISVLFVMTILPIACMVLFHMIKVCRVNASTSSSMSGTHRRQLSMKVIIGILVVFCICTLPSGILWNFIFLSENVASLNMVITAYILGILYYLNSAINPLMYFFFSDKARGTLCVCTKEDEHMGGAHENTESGSASVKSLSGSVHNRV